MVSTMIVYPNITHINLIKIFLKFVKINFTNSEEIIVQQNSSPIGID